jgi:hypothetical protein
MKMDNQNNKIDIEKGSISFWIEANKIKFADNKLYPILNISSSTGSIFIVKDVDNKIKFFYVYLGKGRTDIEWDCSKMKDSKRHMITVTWSQENKEIILYIDGQLEKSTKIIY